MAMRLIDGEVEYNREAGPRSFGEGETISEDS
jgi:hypothetical protein